jgi:hypothetical protein
MKALIDFQLLLYSNSELKLEQSFFACTLHEAMHAIAVYVDGLFDDSIDKAHIQTTDSKIRASKYRDKQTGNWSGWYGEFR